MALQHPRSPTTSPSPTLTITPIAVGDRLPKEPGQYFRITVNEQDLQRMVLEEKSPEVGYQDVMIKIHSDGIVIEAYAYLIMAQMRVHAEAKGTVAIESGQPRFVLTSVTLEDSYRNLTEFISSVMMNTLRKCLYLVLAETAPDITLVQVDLTKIELHEGYMVVEGVTK